MNGSSGNTPVNVHAGLWTGYAMLCCRPAVPEQDCTGNSNSAAPEPQPQPEQHRARARWQAVCSSSI